MAQQLYDVADPVRYDNLFADHLVPILTKGVTLKAAQGIIKRGTVVGIITASALAVPADSTLADGAQFADCILSDDVDTGAVGSTDDVVAVAYSSGHFNRQALIFGGTDTAVDHETHLRELGIYLKDNIAY
ncbi:head decoration protein [Desulfosporosinus sp. OT]|uniref:head decoration protein n=1 Tax=Desulfosporosinus sp. OT TaxID=913865 RepID=UPI000223A5DC|nr:head decoration protein [Desulfosporosinus sp. OT]EGW39169.1 hypothetical protein DOT_2902 [Desulfosporosinus sp. OT]